MHFQTEFHHIVELYRHLMNPSLLRPLLEDYKTEPGETPYDQATRIIRDTVEKNLKGVHHTYYTYGRRFFPVVGIQGFGQAVYWQFRSVIIEGKELIPCKNPNRAFAFVPDRENQEWHSPQCKNRYYVKLNYQEKKLKKKIDDMKAEHGENSPEHVEAVEQYETFIEEKRSAS